jgi:hypothetical protein
MMTEWRGGLFTVYKETVLIGSEGESVPGSASSLAAPPPSVPATPAAPAEPPVQNIHMRSLIVTQDASIIIGRAGAHVNEIRVSDLPRFGYSC